MKQFRLTPVSALAAHLVEKQPAGLDALLLPTSMLFGRNVTRPSDGIQLPADWTQFSGTHCRVFSEVSEVS